MRRARPDYWCAECEQILPESLVIHHWDGHSTHDAEVMDWDYVDDGEIPVAYETHTVKLVHLDSWYDLESDVDEAG